MRIAFYPTMKAPEHSIPSGDREMARLLLLALERSGHEVVIASSLRSYARDSAAAALDALEQQAAHEAARLAQLWHDSSLRPQAWLTYHVYYKSPDLIGPAVARALRIPYLIAEASWSRKRDAGEWKPWQRAAERGISAADVIFSYTAQDRDGLDGAPGRKAEMLALPPFIDAPAHPAPPSKPLRARAELVASAMMRAGNKLESYRFLAQALALLDPLDWHLTLLGDGPQRAAVGGAFQIFAAGRVSFSGLLAPADSAATVAAADLFVWPGVAEAYGMVYLEAQAAGTPVVALASGGTASTFAPGATGLLVSPCTPQAYADAIASLLRDPARRLEMGRAARRFVLEERNVAKAAAILDQGLRLAGAA